ncbi:MAG TPA: hypothetical protein VGJ16_08185, partial [Pirellulales bacterium]
MHSLVSRWMLICAVASYMLARPAIAEEKQNNLVTKLLEVSSSEKPADNYRFTRSGPGWTFFSARGTGQGTLTVKLGGAEGALVECRPNDKGPAEAFRHLAAGDHQLRIEAAGDVRLDQLVVKAVPELMHCGLGFNSTIKSYGLYDLEFLKRDILPNITTLIIPHNLELPQEVKDDWHRQSKKFVAEVGINGMAKTALEHFQHWAGHFDRTPFIDGIIINEFIVNNPSTPNQTLSPERQARRHQEQDRYRVYEQALKLLRGDDRYRGKQVYNYFGGSGKKLNQEVIGPTFVRAIIDCDYRIALERYVHEMSSEEKSKEALQTFVDGIADWEAKEPGAKSHMVVAFGLFSMPPGGINKQPNVDYHVWMDQQMNAVANNPLLDGLAGIEWWTSLLADEETVRFVGKLYRHYGIEGKREPLTRDPLFLSHVENPDFEKGTDDWTLAPAEPSSIEQRSFPRYGRIEGRFMGLGRPADPEHIGDTFLWMKRNEKRPNVFSQTIKNLEPGRLYSMKMLTCDYNDLVHPQAKKQEEATG